MSIEREEFAALILSGRGVTQHSDTVYEVAGHNVTFAGRDAGCARLWRCDCGSEYTCDHIRTVGAAVNDLCDAMGYE